MAAVRGFDRRGSRLRVDRRPRHDGLGDRLWRARRTNRATDGRPRRRRLGFDVGDDGRRRVRTRSAGSAAAARCGSNTTAAASAAASTARRHRDGCVDDHDGRRLDDRGDGRGRRRPRASPARSASRRSAAFCRSSASSAMSAISDQASSEVLSSARLRRSAARALAYWPASISALACFRCVCASCFSASISVDPRLVVGRVDAQDLLDQRDLLLGRLGQRGEAQPGDLVGRLEADDLGEVLPGRAHALVADGGDALLGELVDDLQAGPAGEGLGAGVGRVERAGALEIGEPLDRVAGERGAGEPDFRRRRRLPDRLLQELVRFVTAVGERRRSRLREDAVDRSRRGHVGSLLQIGHGRVWTLVAMPPKTSGVRREPLPPKQPRCHSAMPITFHVIA